MSNYTPTASQVDREMGLGYDYATAVRHLTERHKAEMAALCAVAPEAHQDIANATAQAQAAQERAEAVLTTRQRSIAALKATLLNLARTRARAESIANLKSNPDSTSALAEKLLDAFLLDKDQATSASRAKVEYLMRVFLESTTIAPHVGPYAAKLNSHAEALAETIKSDSRREKISLSGLLAEIRREAAPEQGVVKNAQLLEWFNKGYFDDL